MYGIMKEIGTGRWVICLGQDVIFILAPHDEAYAREILANLNA